MRWRTLAIGLGLILLAAIVFSWWPDSSPQVSGRPDTSLAAAPPSPPVASPPRAEAPRAPAAPVAPPSTPPPSPAPAPAAAPAEPQVIDEAPDFEQLARLGLGPEDLEPVDAGVPIRPVTRDGIKAAVQDQLPEIRECYEAWLRQNPTLAGRLKVQFTISEIPGRDRARVMRVDIADAGFGHVMMEGCVRNVFSSLRFERPRGGETRVTYPLDFSPE